MTDYDRIERTPMVWPDVLWCDQPQVNVMPDQRIQAIITEISEVAVNSRVKELIAELGRVLAELAVNEREHTVDADERFRTVSQLYKDVKRDLRGITQLLETRDHNFAAKLHTMSNHIMALEQQLYEISEAIGPDIDFTRAKIVNGDDSGLSNNDDETTP